MPENKTAEGFELWWKENCAELVSTLEGEDDMGACGESIAIAAWKAGRQSTSPETNYKELEMPPVKGMCMCSHPAATHRDDGRERYCVIIGCGCECFWPTPIPSPAQGQEEGKS